MNPSIYNYQILQHNISAFITAVVSFLFDNHAIAISLQPTHESVTSGNKANWRTDRNNRRVKSMMEPPQQCLGKQSADAKVERCIYANQAGTITQGTVSVTNV